MFKNKMIINSISLALRISGGDCARATLKIIYIFYYFY